MIVNCRTLLIALFAVAPTVNAQLSILPGTIGKTERDQPVEIINDLVITQGDIVVNRIDRQGAGARGFGVGQSLELWPNGIIPFAIDPALGEAEAVRVRQAIAHWNSKTRIELVEYDPPRASGSAGIGGNPGDVGPGPGANDRLVFKPGSRCASWVGRRGGEQSLWVSPQCSVGSMMHEIGHALGLLHEHSRPDRDHYITLDLAQVDPDKLINFERVGQGAQLLGGYDLASIMHYGSHYFSATGQATIKPATAGASLELGQRDVLSAGDIDAINQLYATDVALFVSSEYNAIADVTQVRFDVAVNADQGANQLVITILNNSQLLAYTGDVGGAREPGWQCRHQRKDSVCVLPSLAAHAQSSVEVTLAGRQSVTLANTGLVTRTLDHNRVNNGTPVSGSLAQPVNQQPANDDAGQQLAFALANTATTDNAQGGSGASGPWLLILLAWLLPAWVRLHSKPVVAVG